MESKYSLELVAGNYLYMPYSGYATHDMVCRISQCTGQQWPFPIPGINDREECQARQDIVDISTFGPKRGNEKIYNKYVSEFSPDGLLHIVKVKIKSKDSKRSEALNNWTILQFYFLLGYSTNNFHWESKALYSHWRSIWWSSWKCQQSRWNSWWSSGRCFLQLPQQIHRRDYLLWMGCPRAHSVSQPK